MRFLMLLVIGVLCSCENFDTEFPTGYIQCEPFFSDWPKYRIAKDAEVRNSMVMATAVYEDGGRRREQISLIMVQDCREF